MKILLVTAYFIYPAWNGGAQMSRRVAQGLVAAGHEVVVVCLDFCDRGEKLKAEWGEQDGLRVLIIYPMEQKAGYVKPLWRIRPHLAMEYLARDVLTTEQPDIVYVNFGWEVGDFILVANEMGIPAVFHVHCFSHVCPRQFLMDGWGRICSGPDSVEKCFHCLQAGQKFIRNLIENLARFTILGPILSLLTGEKRASSFILHQAVEEALPYLQCLREATNKFIITSEAIAAVHCEHGVHREKIEILPHFLPKERLQRAASSFRPEKEPIRIGFFGRISSEKGFDLLLSCLTKVEEAHPGTFVLWIITSDVEQLNIDTRLKKAGFSEDRRLIFLGLTGVALNPVLAELDVCIIPSTCREIGPLTLLEAMAQGIPCIVSDSVGMVSLITDRENGRLFPCGDSEALAAALVEVITNPDTLIKWRENLPRICGPEEYIKSLTEIFQRVVNA